MIYAAPGAAGAKLNYKPRYDNFINGRWAAPVKGQYFDVVTPINGKVYTQAARSTAEDIELALDAAHAAFPKWGKTDAYRGEKQQAIQEEQGDRMNYIFRHVTNEVITPAGKLLKNWDGVQWTKA